MHFLKPNITGLKSFARALPLITVLPVTAQTLYQVDVIIFANSNIDGATEETWPQDKLLVYPENTIVLMPENSEKAITPINGQISTIDNPQPTSNSSINNTLANNPATSVDTVNPPLSSTPAHYTELPLQKKMLIEWRDRMRSSGKYRILSHSSWLQPATGPDADKAVVLTGGNQYGEHYELEGSIQIRGKTPPLKIISNLWLSEFLPGGDSEAVQIQLPPLPKPPVLESNPAVNGSLTSEQNIPTTSEATETDTTTTPAIDTAPLYTIKRIITHQSEDNLMPDKPLYLDHPILGILVKISEYKPEQATTPAL